MQFNTTQYYLISPISRVEELENYRQINKDLPSQNSFKTSCLYNNPLEDKKKKKENIIQRLQPSFPLGKSRLTPRQVISPSIFIRRNRNARPTFHSHHDFLKITSDQSADHQSNQRNCWRARGRNTRAHTQRLARIDSYRPDKLGSILLAIRKHLLELGFGDWPPRCLRQTLQLNIREWRVELRD